MEKQKSEKLLETYVRLWYDKHIVADFYRLLFAGQERRGLNIHVCICEWFFGRCYGR